MKSFDTIHQTGSTPLVSFSQADRVMLISGESYPENSFAFYAPVIDWVKEFLDNQDGLGLDINVSYMNSSSTKCILDILDLFEEVHRAGKVMSVTWHYDSENPRSLDLAEEFKEEVTFPFHIVCTKE